jgi:hypothetical protein
MIRQDTNHVVTLPGAQAHQHDPAGRCPVNRIGQVPAAASNSLMPMSEPGIAALWAGARVAQQRGN